MSKSTTQSSVDDPVNVLLVEDNPGDVRLVREALEAIDRDVSLDVFTRGDDVIEALLDPDSVEPYPDLVLLDLNLPGRDGCAVLNAIREDATVNTLPVLMLSGSRTDDDVVRCYEANANAYLSKPDDLEQLTSMMRAMEDFWFDKARLPPLRA